MCFRVGIEPIAIFYRVRTHTHTKKETPGERPELSTSRLTVERAADCAIQDIYTQKQTF